MNQFPSRAQIERLRQTYPPGTRLVLNQMEDSFRKLTEQEIGYNHKVLSHAEFTKSGLLKQ